MLAARIVQELGIIVLGVHFSTGFCTIQRRRRVAREGDIGDKRLRNEALETAATLQLPIEIIDVSSDYIPVVTNPKHGYGSHMNPCQDCRAFMLRKAKEYMEAHDAHFVITGEVVGQRPNSQKKHLLRQTEREAGLEGFVVRPLSAKLLPETVPEREGMIDRNKLYDISGRGRRRQIEMAADFGIEEYAQPSGGCCMLVEEAFSRRLKGYLDNNPVSALTSGVVALLSTGRHLLLNNGKRVIVGRHEGENEYLQSVCDSGYVCLEASKGSSPITLIEKPVTTIDINDAARITAGYSKWKHEPTVEVMIRDGDESRNVTVVPFNSDILWKMNVGADPSSRPEVKATD